MSNLPVPILDTLPTMAWSDKLAFLTYRFLQLPQTDTPVVHIFEPGKYIREMTIPAGTLFIGRKHSKGHEVVLLSGDVVHITENQRIPISAPHTVHTSPGYQMVALILTDVVCRSIHPNEDESRDVEALENAAFDPVEDLVKVGQDIHNRLEQQWLE